MEEIKELLRVVRLNEEKCPWFKQQTLESYKNELMSEAQEVLEAINKGDMENLKEELGDVLYDVLMLMQLAEREGHFKLSESVQSVVEKIQRRKPWLYEKGEISSEEAVRLWKQAKKVEKGG